MGLTVQITAVDQPTSDARDAASDEQVRLDLPATARAKLSGKPFAPIMDEVVSFSRG